jgi:hypothetical protein
MQSTSRFLRRLGFLVAAFAISTSAQAAIQFTVDGLILSDDTGFFAADDPIQIVVTLNNSFDMNEPTNIYGEWFMAWGTHSPIANDVISDISITGATGSYFHSGTGAGSDPFGWINSSMPNWLGVDSYVADLASDSLGLSLNGFDVGGISFQAILDGTNFAGSTDPISPEGWYLSSLGTYSMASDSGGFLMIGDSNQTGFSINSVTIGVAAVPEPRFTACAIAIGAAAFIAVRRKR